MTVEDDYPIKDFSFSIDVMDMQDDCIFRSKHNNFTDAILCGGYIELHISYWITEITHYFQDQTNTSCDGQVYKCSYIVYRLPPL